MTKNLLILTLVIASFTQPAFADYVLNFNERTVDSLLVQSVEQDDYYFVAMSEFVNGAMLNMSALFYIPKDLLSNGTHELEVLKPGKDMRNQFYCQDNPKHEFQLPTQDKIYVIFQDLIDDGSNDKRTKFHGVVAANSKQGDFTISDLTIDDSGTKSFAFNFDIETKNTSYRFLSKAVADELSCKKALKLTTVLFGKVVANTTTNGNAGAVIDAL